LMYRRAFPALSTCLEMKKDACEERNSDSRPTVEFTYSTRWPNCSRQITSVITVSTSFRHWAWMLRNLNALPRSYRLNGIRDQTGKGQWFMPMNLLLRKEKSHEAHRNHLIPSGT